MSANINLTHQHVYAALRSLIIDLLDCEVVQGMDNGVPMPKSDFVVMTILFENRLSTNHTDYTDNEAEQSKHMTQPTQLTVQLDCYGEQSGEWAQILSTTLRDEYACDKLAPNCQPLHADDPRMMQITNSEQQYEERWMVTALLQYNPTVTVAQDFFTSAQPVPVDVF